MLSIAGLAGCETPPATVTKAPVAITVPKPEPVVVVEPPAELGDFHITFYHMIAEDEAERLKPARRPATQLALQPAGATTTAPDQAAVVEPPAAPRMVTLYNGRDCTPLAEVTEKFADHLRLQGTGKLRDGRVLNVYGKCGCEGKRCYQVTDRPWGSAANGRPLEPFRTMAVDPKKVKLGSLLYIPGLDGMTMPGRPPVGGFVHDGCVAADDNGGNIDGKQLDWFVGRRAHFVGLARRRGTHNWAKNVRVLDGSKLCQRVDGRVIRTDVPASARPAIY